MDNLRIEQMLENVERKRARGEWLTYFDDQLKQIDPDLSLVKAQESAEPRMGLIPGLWHVRKINGGGIQDTYLPIDDGNGNFVEPHMGVLDGLRANDLQRPGRMDDLRKAWDAEDRRRADSKLKFREEFKEEFMDRYKAHSNPGVLFGDNSWTARAGARKDR